MNSVVIWTLATQCSLASFSLRFLHDVSRVWLITLLTLSLRNQEGTWPSVRRNGSVEAEIHIGFDSTPHRSIQTHAGDAAS